MVGGECAVRRDGAGFDARQRVDVLIEQLLDGWRVGGAGHRRKCAGEVEPGFDVLGIAAVFDANGGLSPVLAAQHRVVDGAVFAAAVPNACHGPIMTKDADIC